MQPLYDYALKLKSDTYVSLFNVPKTGFEPARPCGHHHLKVACLPISTPGQRAANIASMLFFPSFFYALVTGSTIENVVPLPTSLFFTAILPLW